jgi:hypothetical protein
MRQCTVTTPYSTHIAGLFYLFQLGIYAMNGPAVDDEALLVLLLDVLENYALVSRRHARLVTLSSSALYRSWARFLARMEADMDLHIARMIQRFAYAKSLTLSLQQSNQSLSFMLLDSVFLKAGC